MKKIMILGAGIYQVPLIEKAKSLGLYTIVVSYPGNYPGFALADKIYELDTTDEEQILKAAKAEQIDGICTAGTDVAVKTIGYVCDAMDLNGVSKKAAEIATDKALMKQAFLAGDVETADFFIVKNRDEAFKAAKKLGYPLMVKAVDTSGSRGVIRVLEEAELASAFNRAFTVCRRDHLVMEKCITAKEIGVDGFVRDHKLELFLPHDKFVLKTKDAAIPMGHVFPFSGSSDLYEELYRQLQKAVDSIGIDQSAFNADVFVSGDTCSIIEIGARSGATCIPELISIYTGFDYYELMIKNALGEAMPIPKPVKRPAMAKLLFANVNGTIESIEDSVIDQIQSEGIGCKLDYKVGEQVQVPENGTDRIGHVYMQTDSEETLDLVIDRVLKGIRIKENKS